MKRCNNITCWTDYPFGEALSRIRHVQVLCYDGSRYATVQDLQTGEIEHVKSGYLYRKAEAMKFLRYREDHTKKLARVRMVNLIYWPKTINRRKLERMIPHFVD